MSHQPKETRSICAPSCKLAAPHDGPCSTTACELCGGRITLVGHGIGWECLNPNCHESPRSLVEVANTDRRHQASTLIDAGSNPAGDANDIYEAGWRVAAAWAHRPDLISDIGSGAYRADRDQALATFATRATPEEICERGFEAYQKSADGLVAALADPSPGDVPHE